MTKHCSARLSAAPVVLTSSREQADIAKSYEYGSNSSFVKPLDFADLEALVRNVAHYWLRHNEPPPAPGR